jgi:hypothetical protein
MNYFRYIKSIKYAGISAANVGQNVKELYLLIVFFFYDLIKNQSLGTVPLVNYCNITAVLFSFMIFSRNIRR